MTFGDHVTLAVAYTYIQYSNHHHSIKQNKIIKKSTSQCKFHCLVNCHKASAFMFPQYTNNRSLTHHDDNEGLIEQVKSVKTRRKETCLRQISEENQVNLSIYYYFISTLLLHFTLLSKKIKSRLPMIM